MYTVRNSTFSVHNLSLEAALDLAAEVLTERGASVCVLPTSRVIAELEAQE